MKKRNIIIRERVIENTEDKDITVGYCMLHPLIDNFKSCTLCYGDNKTYTRAQCKKDNWVGRVDSNTVNKMTPDMERRLKEMLNEMD